MTKLFTRLWSGQSSLQLKLPTSGFISGRPATEKDVYDGNAIFVSKVQDIPVGKPIAVTIPQFGYLISKDRMKIAVIIVQAEEANGIRLFGVRDAKGKDYVCQESDLELLGDTRPN